MNCHLIKICCTVGLFLGVQGGTFNAKASSSLEEESTICSLMESYSPKGAYNAGEFWINEARILENENADPQKIMGAKSRAADYMKVAVAKGHIDAQYALGLMYLKGYGLEKNYAQYLNYVQSAADQGHLDAQYALGVSYGTRHLAADIGQNDDIERDITTSLKYLHLAAEKNHLPARYLLWTKYSNHEEGKPAYLNYLEEDAEQGYAPSQKAFADYCLTHLDCMDVVVYYYRQAAEQVNHPDGSREAQASLDAHIALVDDLITQVPL